MSWLLPKSGCVWLLLQPATVEVRVIEHVAVCPSVLCTDLQHSRLRGPFRLASAVIATRGKSHRSDPRGEAEAGVMMAAGHLEAVDEEAAGAEVAAADRGGGRGGRGNDNNRIVVNGVDVSDPTRNFSAAEFNILRQAKYADCYVTAGRKSATPILGM